MAMITADIHTFRELFPEFESYFDALDAENTMSINVVETADDQIESDDDIDSDDQIETIDDADEISINVVSDDEIDTAAKMEAAINSAIKIASEIHRHHPRPIAELHLAAHIVKAQNADAISTLRAERIGPYESEYQRLPDTAKKTRIAYLQSTRYGRIYMQLIARYPTARAARLVST